MGLFDSFFGKTPKSNNCESVKNKNYEASEELMEEDVFWEIIKKTKDSSNGIFEQQQEELEKELRKLAPEQLILFDNSFRNFRGQANTWELWGAIYIIHGGCSDDTFTDFREWVIAQGKNFYYKIVSNPDSLAEMDADEIEEFDWEGFGYLPRLIFEEITAQKMPSLFQEKLDTTGNTWAEDSDDLKYLLPKLFTKYAH